MGIDRPPEKFCAAAGELDEIDRLREHERGKCNGKTEQGKVVHGRNAGGCHAVDNATDASSGRPGNASKSRKERNQLIRS
jgi:hypothetical protein